MALPLPAGSALRLVEPPWCSGPRPGRLIDVALLAFRLRRAGRAGRWAVLSDIPDDFASLEQALALPEVAGAAALACSGVDIWLGEDQEEALRAWTLRREGGTTLVRVELRSGEESEAFLRVLAAAL